MNNSNSILLIDPSFDPAMATACSLLIKLGVDSFSYAIINKETNEVSAVFDEQECESGFKKFAEHFKTDPYLALNYRDVKAAIHTPGNLHIPNELFNEDELAIYSPFLAAAHSEVHANKQPHFGFTTLFAAPHSTIEILNGLNARIFDGTAGLLAIGKQAVHPTLLLDFTAGSCCALYLKDGQLVFQQCFEIENAEEFNYYLLLMINQLEMDIDETVIQLMGIVHEEDDKFRCLRKYFKDIRLLAMANQINQQVLADMPAHYYASLLALDQCG